MGKPRCSESEFIRLFETLGAQGAAEHLSLPPRKVYERRAAIERRIGRPITNPGNAEVVQKAMLDNPSWLQYEVIDGYVLVGSDAHYWPNYVSTAHRGMVRFAKKFQPKIIALNGDIMDAATISRHPPIGWESVPSIEQELAVVDERLHELQRAAPNAKRVWTLGNHDARFETRLAMVAPEYKGVRGVHLKDHFPYWEPCWSAIINNDVVIKHRFKSGMHAPHNNALWSGKTMITGHLHSAKVVPLTDYNGTRYGVDGGTLADPYGPQFRDYTEQNPLNWRSAFAVLRFINGKLAQPQLAMVAGDGVIDYCNELIEV